MSYILNIESATKNCSVSIGYQGETVALKELSAEQFNHAEKLHTFILECLQSIGISLQDLAAVAVSKGPGSYTGLRIGVSAAKGFCFSLDIPLISVPTLTSLAHQVGQGEADFIFPLLDARRMEVYTAGFDAEKEQIMETQAKILDETSFKEYLEKGKLAFIGDGVAKFREICTHENAVFIEGKLPSAKE